MCRRVIRLRKGIRDEQNIVKMLVVQLDKAGSPSVGLDYLGGKGCLDGILSRIRLDTVELHSGLQSNGKASASS